VAVLVDVQAGIAEEVHVVTNLSREWIWLPLHAGTAFGSPAGHAINDRHLTEDRASICRARGGFKIYAHASLDWGLNVILLSGSVA
jgi:hypothetical protein